MIRRALLRRLDRAALGAEIEAQIRTFVRAFGRAPDFVDGHHHVHLLPQIRDEVLGLARRMTPGAWVRQCGSAWPMQRLLRDPKVLGLSLLSRGMRRKAAALSVETNPAFGGAYDFDRDAEFAALFPRFLDGLPDLGLVMCHPGFVDSELEQLDPLTAAREREYSYLASDAFLRALDAADATLA
jgi:hypothetical protein